jgi:hypothetical protein
MVAPVPASKPAIAAPVIRNLFIFVISLSDLQFILNLLLPFRRIARREDQSPKRSHFRDRKPARRLWGASPKLSLRFLRTIPVPVRRTLEQRIRPVTRRPRTAKFENLLLTFLYIASKQSLPTKLGYNQDPRSVEFIPCQDVPSNCEYCSKDFGMTGPHTCALF